MSVILRSSPEDLIVAPHVPVLPGAAVSLRDASPERLGLPSTLLVQLIEPVVPSVGEVTVVRRSSLRTRIPARRQMENIYNHLSVWLKSFL